jgi:hypothetical protein
MKKKHTAMQQIINLIRFDKIYLNGLTIDDFEVQFKRLLELEKQQIKDAYESLEHRHGENYYNETFKKTEQ